MGKLKNTMSGTETLFRIVMFLPPPLKKLSVNDTDVFLGSCFADSIGGIFKESRLNAVVCPLGPSYCPASIARILETERANDVVSGPAGWHTWLSDTSLTGDTKEACMQATQQALDNLHTALLIADNLFLTLGTNHTYILRSTGEVVVNCHKHPQREFLEEVQSVEDMTAVLDKALCRLRKRNTKLTVTLTVSPYRYAKYGFHESSLSKASLLMAADALQKRHPDWIQYFPAYELVMDELRDYRFYAEDMLHPSPLTIRYIWQRLWEWMDDDMLEYLRRWKPIGQALCHRPMHPSQSEWQNFVERTDKEMEKLQQDYPMLRVKSKP